MEAKINKEIKKENKRGRRFKRILKFMEDCGGESRYFVLMLFEKESDDRE